MASEKVRLSAGIVSAGQPGIIETEHCRRKYASPRALSVRPSSPGTRSAHRSEKVRLSAGIVRCLLIQPNGQKSLESEKVRLSAGIVSSRQSSWPHGREGRRKYASPRALSGLLCNLLYFRLLGKIFASGSV